MAIASYADLLAAVGDYLNDSTLSARIPAMISLAEAEFNRVLNVMEQDARATTPVTGQYVTAPPDLMAVRAVYLTTEGYQALEQVPLVDLRRLHWDGATGKPTHYAFADGQFILGPAPDTTYELEILYVQDIPALTEEAPTNWLLLKHPDLYLFATLLQAEFFKWNDARLPLISARVQDIIRQIGRDGTNKRAGASPLRMRHGQRE